MKNELSAVYKVTNKYIKRDYAKYREDTIERHLQQTGSSQKAFKELKMNKTWVEELGKQDKTLNKRTDIINAASDFYRKLYSDVIQNNNAPNTNKIKDERYMKPVDEIEVIEAIKRLKFKKLWIGQDH
ncbi:endonuclease-reverse transcriptase [Danaus plexippus plexippus]|uniref:Endonuclease-reverse transcriptase n=1 Tax=Danaus plexippus plexippus TaxID=278856 RepID=A0A212EP86_DANPL|nr:endonuclease-reverse transcriptase [Danaus plexippus plexippus]